MCAYVLWDFVKVARHGRLSLAGTLVIACVRSVVSESGDIDTDLVDKQSSTQDRLQGEEIVEIKNNAE